MGPQGLGLKIVQDEPVLIEAARMTKVEDSLFHLAAVHDGRTAQGSPGDDDRAAPHFVLDDFMYIEKVMAVSACFLAVGDSNYG